MNFVPGDCDRKSSAGCWRQTQTNLLTDMETFELWELEHRSSNTVEIILLVDDASEYKRLGESKSLRGDEAPFKNLWRIAYREFLNKFNSILTDRSNRG